MLPFKEAYVNELTTSHNFLSKEDGLKQNINLLFNIISITKHY